MKFTKKLVKWSKGIAVALLFTFLSTSLVFSAPDNFKYRQWCMDTFYNGSQIYEAYKVVAFDIEYVKDVFPFLDYWQTPIETFKLKKGDCEDAIILFSSLISVCNEDVRLVWGYIYGKESGGKAKHVWIELTSKNKTTYILEAYKGDWGGIIKKEIDEQTLMRDEITSLPQCLYTEVLKVLAEIDDYNEEEHKLVIKYLSAMITSGKDSLLSNGAYDIFKMLHETANREVAFAEKN